MNLSFGILKGSFTIHRLSPGREIPANISRSSFYSISKTDEELSIVCASSLPVDSEQSDTGWACLKVIGPLEISLTGILRDISGILAMAGISIFAVSTFDTDYILVKSESLEDAKKVLIKAGHTFPD